VDVEGVVVQFDAGTQSAAERDRQVQVADERHIAQDAGFSGQQGSNHHFGDCVFRATEPHLTVQGRPTLYQIKGG
jgi:hypothetical protein